MKLNVMMHPGGVKLYGERVFFRLLTTEADRMASRNLGDYAEFQTDGIAESVTVFKVDDEFVGQSAACIDANQFDVNFMVIEEDQDFQKM